jgi:hypothetical protein
VDAPIAVTPSVRWAISWAIVGLLGGALAPFTAIVVWVIVLQLPATSFDPFVLFGSSAGVCGIVGGAAGAATAYAHGKGLALGRLMPAGFPIGSVGGGLAAWVSIQAAFGPRIQAELLPEAVWAGVVCGGLHVGLTWPLWILVLRRGRPAWPVLALCSLTAPVFAVVVMVAPTLALWAT